MGAFPALKIVRPGSQFQECEYFSSVYYLLDANLGTPPHDIIEDIAKTIVSTIPRQKMELHPTKKDNASAATPGETKPASAERSLHTDLSLEAKK
ncbi:hypothetical protein Tco_1515670 [Tanacetum coccineum]